VHRPAAALPGLRAGRPLSIGRRLSRLAAPVLAGLALVVALGVAAGLTPGMDFQSPWKVQRPLNARRTGTFQHPSLKESSGVAASRRQPGILWTLNDSGNEPLIFATDTLGRDYGAFTVTDAHNEDWEAIALGPCGRQECLYIADTGDNERGRRTVRLYRVSEPLLPADRRRTRRAEVLELRYPGGSRDVEAMFVGGDGAAHLMTKTRGGPVQVFRVPASSWGGGHTVTAEAVGTLPIESAGLADMVTDAAISPSGERVAVRTYRSVYLFGFAGQGDLLPLGVACDAAGLQLQGEGISWLDDRVLVLTSEGGFGSPGTIVLLECGGARLDQ
jgi:hypothetical protein